MRLEREHWESGTFRWTLWWGATLVARVYRTVTETNYHMLDLRLGKWELSFPTVGLCKWEGNTGKHKFDIFCTCGRIGSCSEHRFCGVCEECRIRLEDYPPAS
jgi:hypothetical protein